MRVLIAALLFAISYAQTEEAAVGEDYLVRRMQKMAVRDFGMQTCDGQDNVAFIDRPCTADEPCELKDCKEFCLGNAECEFFYFNDRGFCGMYRNCDVLRDQRVPGHTFEKINSFQVIHVRDFGSQTCDGQNNVAFIDRPCTADEPCLLEDCKAFCLNDEECKFFYFNTRGFCGMYRNCDVLRDIRVAGNTYEKTDIVEQNSFGTQTCDGQGGQAFVGRPCTADEPCELQDCIRNCAVSAECKYLYFNNLGFCGMYSQCDVLRQVNHPGTTYRKVISEPESLSTTRMLMDLLTNDFIINGFAVLGLVAIGVSAFLYNQAKGKYEEIPEAQI